MKLRSPSFLRKQESRLRTFPQNLWIPAFAGMRAKSVIPECLNRESSKVQRESKAWIPAFAGMTGRAFAGIIVLALFLFPACKSTYSRDKVKEEIIQLAQKEYKLQMNVLEKGDTITAWYNINNLRGELLADDQVVWKDAEHLLLVLSRVTLSMKNPPQFFVLELVDEKNPRIRFSFTRYVEDIKKYFSEAMSMTQFFDSLLMEFIIGDERKVFDPEEMDMVRFLMMAIVADEGSGKNPPLAMEAQEIRLPDFLAGIAANRTRRLLRERPDMKKNYYLRKVVGRFEEEGSQYKFFLDLVPKPAAGVPSQFMEKTIFPFVAKEIDQLLKSYKFKGFHKILLSDKYSGKAAVFPRTQSWREAF